MANKRIKRVIIAGAGFSAPAKLPIQSRIIDRMAEVPEMDFLTGKMPEESMTFLDAFITVGLFLLDNYAKKDYTEYRVKYQKLVDKDLAYRTFFGAQEIDFKSLWSEETSKTLNSIFSDEAAHSKHVSNYYSEVYSIRENIRKAIQDEKINVNLEDVFTAFDKSIIVREHLHGYTYHGRKKRASPNGTALRIEYSVLHPQHRRSVLLLLHQKFQAVIQNLLLALGQHGQIEFTLDRQQFRDTFEKVMERIEVDS